MRTLGVAILVCAAPLGVRAAAGVHEAASRAYAEAIAERDAGDPQAAIAKLRQVLDLVPDSGESYWALAWILDSQAQEKEACEAWRKASELLPAGDPRRVSEGGRPLASAPGLKLLGPAGPALALEAAAGQYVFTIK